MLVLISVTEIYNPDRKMDRSHNNTGKHKTAEGKHTMKLQADYVRVRQLRVKQNRFIIDDL